MKTLNLARCGNRWPHRVLLIGLAILVLSFIDHPMVFAQSDELDTNMAKDPKELVESVTVPAFLPPDEYHRQLSEAADQAHFPNRCCSSETTTRNRQ